jgi:long-chain acyl-CoA synthetase
MAASGESLSYGELDARSNRLAHFLRAQGLERLDHYAIFMENHVRFLEACVAGERSGLYYTCVNSYLTADELAYIVNNSRSRVLITSAARFAVAREALRSARGSWPAWWWTPPATRGARLRADAARLPVDADPGRVPRHADAVLLGHHRTPQGRAAPAAAQPAVGAACHHPLPRRLWQCEEGMRYLSPRRCTTRRPSPTRAAHSQRRTVVVMEKFDAGALPAARGAAPHHAHPAGAHDVQPHAEAAA